jgi:tetratricopeptide (TPR) repeat protein
LGEFDEAIYYADEAISRGLDGIQIAFEKCGALLSSGRYEEALIQSEHMMVFDWPKGATGDMGIYTYKKFVLRARALSHFQRFEEALACLDVALYASPDYGPALFSKAQILEQTGDSESALQLYRKASLDPACAAAASAAAANLLKGSGRYQEAAELWHQIWVNDREALSAWLQWKQVCELAENPILLLQCFEQLAATRQLDAELMVDWGRAWAAAGRSADAIRCFAEAMKLEPGYANAYFNCGDVMLQAGMADRSVEMYRAGLSLTPEHAAGWFVLGNALAHCGREQASIEAYERALEIEPGHPGALYNLGSLRAA